MIKRSLIEILLLLDHVECSPSNIFSIYRRVCKPLKLVSKWQCKTDTALMHAGRSIKVPSTLVLSPYSCFVSWSSSPTNLYCSVQGSKQYQLWRFFVKFIHLSSEVVGTEKGYCKLLYEDLKIWYEKHPATKKRGHYSILVHWTWSFQTDVWQCNFSGWLWDEGCCCWLHWPHQWLYLFLVLNECNCVQWRHW